MACIELIRHCCQTVCRAVDGIMYAAVGVGALDDPRKTI